MEDSGAELCYSVLYYYHYHIIMSHTHQCAYSPQSPKRSNTFSNFSNHITIATLVDNVELFFTCAFAFLYWRIVKNNSETIEHKTNLTFLIKNV